MAEILSSRFLYQKWNRNVSLQDDEKKNGESGWKISFLPVRIVGLMSAGVCRKRRMRCRVVKMIWNRRRPAYIVEPGGGVENVKKRGCYLRFFRRMRTLPALSCNSMLPCA